MRIDRQISAAAQTLATSVAINVANLMTGVMAARVLLAQGRGELASVQLWGAIIAAFAVVGLDQAAIYFLSGTKADDRRVIIARILATAMVTTVAVASLTGVYVLLTGGLQGATTPELRYLPALYVVVNNVGVVLVAMLLAAGAMGKWNLVRASVHYFSVLFMAAAFLGGLTSAGAAAWAILLANVLSVGIAAVWIYRLFFTGAPGRTSSEISISDILKYGIGVQGTAVFRMLFERLDQLAITMLLGARELGFYVVGVVLVRAVSGVVAPLEQILFRKLSTRGDRHTPTFGLVPLFTAGLIGTSLLTSFIWFGAPLFILLLFGAEFAASAKVLQLSSLTLPAFVGRLVIGSYLKSYGKPSYASAMELVALVALGLAISVLYTHGLVGIVIAVVLSSWLAFIVSVVVISRTMSAWRFDLIGAEFSALLALTKRSQ